METTTTIRIHPETQCWVFWDNFDAASDRVDREEFVFMDDTCKRFFQAGWEYGVGHWAEEINETSYNQLIRIAHPVMAGCYWWLEESVNDAVKE